MFHLTRTVGTTGEILQHIINKLSYWAKNYCIYDYFEAQTGFQSKMNPVGNVHVLYGLDSRHINTNLNFLESLLIFLKTFTAWFTRKYGIY